MCGAIVSVLHSTPIGRCDYLSFAQHSSWAVRLSQAGTMPKQSRPALPIPPTVSPPQMQNHSWPRAVFHTVPGLAFSLLVKLQKNVILPGVFEIPRTVCA
jgi:hypothetical protein